MRLSSALFFAACLAAAGNCAVAAEGTQGLRATLDGDQVEPVDETTTAGILLRPTVPELDPYEALGIRAGGFILYPSLTVTTGYTTNASESATGTGAGFGVLTPELLLNSDWSRHAISLKLRGSYEQFFDGSAANPSASADLTGRLDFADGWTSDLAAGYAFAKQALSDAYLPAGIDAPPGVHNITASAALNGHSGRTAITFAGSFARTSYDNATSGGIPVDQGFRTNSVFGARLRAGYEITPTIVPFAEGELTRRAYDRLVDPGGLRRSSTGIAYRGGVAFDRDPFVSGEVSVGFAQEDFDDTTLATLSAMTFDGSLVWSPTQLTTVTFDGTTTLNPSASAASTGSVAYDGSVDIAYAWRRNVTFDWIAGFSHERFAGTNQVDTTYRAGANVVWKVNRTLYLTAGYLHKWRQSTAPSNAYTSDAVRLELRLQR